MKHKFVHSMLKPIVPFLFLLSGIQSSAASNTNFQVNILGSKQLKSESKYVQTLLGKVSQMISPMETPPGITINLRPIGSNAESRTQDRSLEIAVDYGGGLYPAERSQEFNDGVNVHEFGHAIFDYNMGKTNPVYLKAMTLSSISKRTTAEMEQLIEQVKIFGKSKKKKRGSEIDMEKFERLTAKIQSLSYISSEADNLRAESPYYNIDSRALAYNEYFADVIAVLYSNKPDTLSASMSFRAGQEKSKDMEVYPVEVLLSNAQLRNFVGTDSGQSEFTSAHGVFSQSRLHVWNYISNSSISRSTIARNVFEAIAEEISWLLENPEIDPMKNAALANTRLNQAIDKQFSK